jgi:hypothetical protein
VPKPPYAKGAVLVGDYAGVYEVSFGDVVVAAARGCVRPAVDGDGQKVKVRLNAKLFVGFPAQHARYFG